MKTFALLLCVLLILGRSFAQQEEGEKAKGCLRPLLQNKCKKRDCIQRVEGTEIDWGEVTPRTFVVRWGAAPGARCYHIQLLRGYTINVMRTIYCYQGTFFEFDNLRPSMIYGVQVSAVNHKCRRGRPGIPARIRTLWAPTTKPTTTQAATTTPEPGSCGRGFFTCHSDPSECVKMDTWCDRRLDCMDASDERGCPGGCEEVDIDFTGGNYSCSRWGSPRSVCLFDCQYPYVRDGARYIFCSKKLKRWINTIPTCRLRQTNMFELIEEETTATSLTFDWDPIEEAARYTLLAIEQRQDVGVPLMRTVSINASECCKATVTLLPPETEFKVTVMAVDENDVDGTQSSPIFARTAAKVEAVIEEDEEEEE